MKGKKAERKIISFGRKGGRKVKEKLRQHPKYQRSNTKFERKGEETNEKRTSCTTETKKSVVFNE